MRTKSVIFSVTSACNYNCSWCDIPRAFKHEFVDLGLAKELLHKLKKLGVIYVQITGGEPTLHPDLLDIVRFADKQGFVIQLMTNGSLITLDYAEELRKSGVDIVSVSLDHYRAEPMDEWRGVKGAWQKAVSALRNLNQVGVMTSANTLISPLNVEELEQVVSYVAEELSTKFAACTPTAAETESWSFKSTEASEDLILSGVQKLLSIYDHRRFWDPVEYYQEVYRHYKGLKRRFPCFGGYVVFYTDWMGNLYPCFNKPKVATIDEIDDIKPVERPCYDCVASCFLLPSIFWRLMNSAKTAPKLLGSYFSLRLAKSIVGAYINGLRTR